MQEFDDYKKYIFVGGGDNGRKAVSSNRNGK